MKHRLKHGEPIKHPKRKDAPVYYPCQCVSCALDAYIDPRTQASTTGKLLLSQREWKVHNPSVVDKDHRGNAGALWDTFTADDSEEDEEHPIDQATVKEDTKLDDEHVPSRTAPSSPRNSNYISQSPIRSNPEVDSLRLCYEKLSGWSETLDEISQTPFFFLPSDNISAPTEAPNGSPGPIPSLDISKDAPVVHYTAYLEECRKIAARAKTTSHSRQHLLGKSIEREVANAFSKLEDIKRAKWAIQHEIHVVDTSRYMSSLDSYAWNPIPLLCMITVSTLSAFGSLSIDRAAFLLAQLQLLIFTMANAFQVPSDRRDVLIEGIPSDVRTAMGRLDVAPVTKPFICCPRCYALYDIPSNPSEGLKCSNIPIPGEDPCGRTLLRRTTRGTWEPTRRYVYHDFKQWLGRMYARPGIEKYLDRSLKDMSSGTPGELKDIWDGSVLQNFKGPDGVRHFLDGDGEGRLVFGLNQDGMNPFGNSIGGAKVSVGPIYMVCFNLPPELRYRTENIFLTGIIPGPKEAKGDQINHLLRPLVDDLYASWDVGIFLSRTAAYPQGRRVRCALVPIIADLPAARVLAGLGSPRSTHWCSECHAVIQNADDLEKWCWVMRNETTHRECAQLWRDAPDKETREKLWAEHHIRYSEFLRLPYWDPTKYVTIDSMHGFYLGLFQRHIRKIWGMDVRVEEGGVDLSSQRGAYTATDAETAVVFDRLRKRGDHKNLEEAVLVSMCRDVGLRYAGSKGKLYRRLAEHYRSHEIPSPPAPYSSMAPEAEPSVSEEHVAFHSETKTALRKHGAVFLARMCFKILGKTTEDEYKKWTVSRMLEVLQAERKAQGIVNENGKIIVSASSRHPGKKASHSVLLGAHILAEVRKDMERRKLPNYIGRSPTNPGDASGRKFTADQWRSFCLMHLPYTLTRLWGGFRNSDDPAKQHLYKALENYLQLVTAVKVAVAKTQNSTTIERHETLFVGYLGGLLELYPGTQIESYQHLIMHFGDQLRRWGPTQSWRCFAFERYNGMLQNIPTNRKFGEMEETMCISFCRRQNLTAMYSPQTLPEELAPAREAFMRHLHYDSRGTWSEDVNGEEMRHRFHIIGDLEQLTPRSADGLYRWMSKRGFSPSVGAQRGQYADQVTTGRTTFVARKQGSASGKGNPLQTVVTQDGRVGLIREIFLYTWKVGDSVFTDVFLLVHCYIELSVKDAAHDDFRLFPIASGRLVYNRVTADVFSLAEVVHCTVTAHKVKGINESVNHVLPIVYDELTTPEEDT